MDAARRLDSTVLLANQARKHAKGALDGPERTRARKRLKQLRTVIQELIAEVIRDGLSKDASSHLSNLLDPVDAALEEFLRHRATPESMDVVAETARACRRALSEGLE